MLVKSVSAQQKNVFERPSAWLGLFNQTRITSKWGTWLDIHTRSVDDDGFKPDVLIFRPGLAYYLKDNLRVMAGYAYVQFFAPTGRNTNWHEHRPWQQIWWRQDYNGYQTIQWLRLEERYVRRVDKDTLTSHYRFNYRFRYNFSLNIPLTSKKVEPKVPYIVIQDELFINMGRQVGLNIFDQNRFFVGLGYMIKPSWNINLGYMNLYQQRPNGTDFNYYHTVRLFVFHSLDFRKKDQ